MLPTFLLAGCYLDRRMRRRTRDFAANPSAIRADRATKLNDDGEAREAPIAAIRPGELVLVRAGERIAVDGTVEDGRSEVDQSRVTGETRFVEVSPGAQVYAGSLSLTGGLRVRVKNAATGTLLDEVNALLAKAVEQRSSYVRLADRAARWYAPVVHLTALATCLGWLALGAGWERATIVAITVLIITCPCALGLAVPAVQVVAAGAMFRRGVHPQFRRGARAARGSGHGRVRQNWHADASRGQRSPTAPTSRPTTLSLPDRLRWPADIRWPERSSRRRAPQRR